MEARNLFRLLFIPCTVISIILSIVTLFLYFSGFSNANSSELLAFLELFDLHGSGNIGTWFKGILVFLCGLSFLLVGINNSGLIKLSKISLLFFKFTGIAGILLSIEVIAAIHRKIDVRVVNILGVFSESLQEKGSLPWLIFLAGLLGLIFLLNLLRLIFILIKNIPPSERVRHQLIIILIVIIISFALTIVFEGAQGYLWYHGVRTTIVSYLEEVLKLTAFCGIFGFNIKLAEYYKL